MAGVGDHDEPPPPRERWLHVVRDDEPPDLTPEPPAPLVQGPPEPPAQRPAEPLVQGPPAPLVQGPPAGERPAEPEQATGREPGSWGRPAARQTWSRTIPVTTATARVAPAPHPRPPEPAGPASPPVPWPVDRAVPPGIQPRPPDRIGGTARGTGRAAAVLVAVVALGTAGAVAADWVVGRPGDGRPALHLLVALALPFWDALPGRILPRLAVVTAVVTAVAAIWFGLAMLADPPWWRAEVSFGLACLVAGAGHLLAAAALRARRTVAA